MITLSFVVGFPSCPVVLRDLFNPTLVPRVFPCCYRWSSCVHATVTLEAER